MRSSQRRPKRPHRGLGPGRARSPPPSAFVVAKFGKAPVLDPDNMPKFDGTPEEWEAFDRLIRESRGR